MNWFTDKFAARDQVNGIWLGTGRHTAAEADVLAACARHGRRAGLLLRSGMRLDALRDRGFSLLALGSDIGCLKQGFAKMLTPTR